MPDEIGPRGPEYFSQQDKACADAADELARLVLEYTDDRGYHSLEALGEASAEYRRQRFGTDDGRVPVTAIEERLARMAWVLRRLVSTLGFQAELVAYGGDYEERGTSIHRDCRISIRRRTLGGEELAALVDFAQIHGCELEFSEQHGTTLRLGEDADPVSVVRSGNHIELTAASGVEVNAEPTTANTTNEG